MGDYNLTQSKSFSRRRFLQSTLLGLSGTALGFKQSIFGNNGIIGERPRILLRGSWHSINIGDIGHTVGNINLIKTYLPEVEIILWPKNVRIGVKEMILRRFPNLKMVEQEHEVKAAFQTCDFFLHGSGPSLAGLNELEQWHEETGKPFGIFGIGIGNKNAREKRELLSQAEFFFFR